MFTMMSMTVGMSCASVSFFFQAEDGIRDLVRSRGLGDVYKRQVSEHPEQPEHDVGVRRGVGGHHVRFRPGVEVQQLSLIHI